jgi:hypothetical protein
VLSIDIMDISGEHQNDVNHDITKSRLDKSGKPVEGAQAGRALKGDLELVASATADGCMFLRSDPLSSAAKLFELGQTVALVTEARPLNPVAAIHARKSVNRTLAADGASATPMVSSR